MSRHDRSQIVDVTTEEVADFNVTPEKVTNLTFFAEEVAKFYVTTESSREI